MKLRLATYHSLRSTCITSHLAALVVIRYFTALTLSRRLHMATCHSLCFPTYPLQCQWGYTWQTITHSASQPTFYRECYGFERAFSTHKRFLPCNLSWGFPGVGSPTSKLAGFHAVVQAYSRPYHFKTLQDNELLQLFSKKCNS